MSRPIRPQNLDAYVISQIALISDNVALSVFQYDHLRFINQLIENSNNDFNLIAEIEVNRKMNQESQDILVVYPTKLDDRTTRILSILLDA